MKLKRIISLLDNHWLSQLDKLLYFNEKNKININDIVLFDSDKKFTKSMNDHNNKLREIIISSVINNKIPKYWFYHDIKWSIFRYKLLKYIDMVSDSKYDRISCFMKAGRRFSYDFDISYHCNNEVNVKKIEFKFAVSEIQKSPQFLSLSAKSFGNYSEFFYDNYIDKISDLINIEKPIKNKYLKYVNGIDYNKDIWFSNLYSNEKYIKEIKKDIVNESISKYLEIFIDTLDISYIRQKILSSQSGKTYMYYNNNEFTSGLLSVDDLTITKILSLKKNNFGHNTSIIFETKTKSTIILLLRWRNRAGILNPAWQISIKK